MNKTKLMFLISTNVSGYSSNNNSIKSNFSVY